MDDEILKLKSKVWHIVFSRYIKNRIKYPSIYEQYINPFNKIFKSHWIYYLMFLNEYKGSDNFNDIIYEFNIFLDKFNIKIDTLEYEKMFNVIYQLPFNRKYSIFKGFYITFVPKWLKKYGEDCSTKDITEDDAFYDVQMLDKYYKCRYQFKQLYAVLQYINNHNENLYVDAENLWIGAIHNIEYPNMYQRTFYCQNNKYFHVFKSVYNRHFKGDMIKNVFFSNDYKKSITILHEFIQAFIK
jgi:hypothetical protein